MLEPISPRLAGVIRGFLWLIVAMFVTGLLLSAIYRPDPELLSGGFREQIARQPWHFLAAFHYWGSATCIVAGGVLVAWVFIIGFETKARRLWLPLVACTGLCVALQVLGNALPMDRHDVQTVNVEASIASRTPVVGPAFAAAMLGGDKYSPKTVSIWYSASIIAAVVLVAAALWLAFRLRQCAPRQTDLPEWLSTVGAVAMPILLALLLPRAQGEAFQPEDFTGQSAQPSWYVLPMHAMLQAFERVSPGLGWIGSALLPAIGVAAIVFASSWAGRLRMEARRNLVLAVLAGMGALTAWIGAKPAPISGNQPIVEVESVKSNQPVDEKLASAGRTVFDKSCAGCHGIGGVGAAGAPSVIGFHKKVNDPKWIMDFIRNPSSKKPGSTMPGFPQLPESELKALAEWLRKPK